jgi:hypothetical protein
MELILTGWRLGFFRRPKLTPRRAWRFWGGSSPSRRKAHWTPLLSFVMSMKPRIKGPGAPPQSGVKVGKTRRAALQNSRLSYAPPPRRLRPVAQTGWQEKTNGWHAAASPPAARGNRAEAWREQLRPQGQSMRRRSKSLAFDKPRNLFASGSNVGRNVGPACLTLAERQQFAGRSAVCWVPVRALEKNHMNNGQNEECNDCEECHRQ